MCCSLLFFCFKQKTAYEMRISDWSSDVCSSDLDGVVTHLPAEAREVFDVSGAGDTVVSTLAAALGAGLPLVDAAGFANAAAGLVVGKVGTAVVYRDELAAKLRERKLTSLDQKVATQHLAQDITAGWRRKDRQSGR